MLVSLAFPSSLPLFACLAGQGSPVWFVVGTLVGGEVQWAAHALHMQAAWAACARQVEASRGLRIEFAVVRDGEREIIASCEVTHALVHECRKISRQQRRAFGGGPTPVRSRWPDFRSDPPGR